MIENAPSTSPVTGPQAGRYHADFPPGTVIFLIGMRINELWNVRKWGPTFLAMGPMLTELSKKPDLGLLGFNTWVGWRSVMVQQYWSSIDQLMEYAAAKDAAHLPAWKRFNARVGHDNSSVGVWHEAYVVDPATSHIVYVNMPAFGMAKATSLRPAREMGVQPMHRRDASFTADAATSHHSHSRMSE